MCVCVYVYVCVCVYVYVCVCVCVCVCVSYSVKYRNFLFTDTVCGLSTVSLQTTRKNSKTNLPMDHGTLEVALQHDRRLRSYMTTKFQNEEQPSAH